MWKRVESYARDGFTSLIHGKYYHEETRGDRIAGAEVRRRALLHRPELEEAQMVCDFVEGRVSAQALMERFAHAASPNFDPARDLRRIGVANQTTMLAQESMAIGALVGEGDGARSRRSLRERELPHLRHDLQRDPGAAGRGRRAPAEPLDVMVVIGGYNSSNTISLAAMCSESVRTYHVEDADDIDPESGTIRHRPLGAKESIETEGWLPLCRSPPRRSDCRRQHPQ